LIYGVFCFVACIIRDQEQFMGIKDQAQPDSFIWATSPKELPFL